MRATSGSRCCHFVSKQPRFWANGGKIGCIFVVFVLATIVTCVATSSASANERGRYEEVWKQWCGERAALRMQTSEKDRDFDRKPTNLAQDAYLGDRDGYSSSISMEWLELWLECMGAGEYYEDFVANARVLSGVAQLFRAVELGHAEQCLENEGYGGAEMQSKSDVRPSILQQTEIEQDQTRIVEESLKRRVKHDVGTGESKSSLVQHLSSDKAVVDQCQTSVLESTLNLQLSHSLLNARFSHCLMFTGNALVDSYESTNGAGWRNNSNWLQGDPCTNQWLGVYCSSNCSVGTLYVLNNLFR